MKLVINDDSFKALIKRVKTKVPVVMREIADEVLANTAAEARLDEQSNAHTLKLGMWQHTVRTRKNGVREVIEGVNLKKERAGWVSARYHTSTGPFRMASFSWELARRPSTREVSYTSQLANLWSHPTKRYGKASPKVGRQAPFMQWAKGAVRPTKYDWNSLRGKFVAHIPSAVLRAEKDPKIKKMLEDI